MLVASRGTGSARGRFRVSSLEYPVAERHGIPDVLLPIHRVYFVTGATGSAFGFLVDMHGVQVHIAIPKSSQIRCLRDYG